MEVRKNIIVKLDALGDFFLWIDAGNALIDKWLSDQIDVTLVCNKTNLSVASKYISNSSKVSLIGINSLEELKNVVSGVHYDYLYQCAYNNTKYIDEAVKIISATEKVSMKGSKKIYSLVMSCIDEWTHEYIKNMEFASLILDEEIEFTKHIRTVQKQDFFIAAPFSSSSKKSYSMEKMTKVIGYVLKSANLKCVVIGSSSDYNDAEKMIYCINSNNCINMTGKTNVLEYIDMISRSAFVIGNDSSCIHIASFFGVPSICIAGGQHWGRFVPYDNRLGDYFIFPRVVNHEMKCYHCSLDRKNKSLRCNLNHFGAKRFPCIENISVDDVLDETTDIMRSEGFIDNKCL